MHQVPLEASASGIEAILAGGGEMGALVRAFDWARTPLGAADRWPQSLRTAASICLASQFPMLIWWGPELIQLYNTAYRPVLGAKHPRSLGQRGDECWAEVWDVLGPLCRHVWRTGEATWSEDLLLPMERHGYLEETYFTFSYSPIRDESGGVGGVLVTCVETTDRVLGERRLRTLRELGARAGDARSANAACAAAAATLGENPADAPFALLYLVEEGGRRARLAGAAGIEAGHAATPGVVALDAPAGERAWPLGRVVESGLSELVTGLSTRFGSLPGGRWAQAPEAALVLPVTVAGQPDPTAVLVAGVNARRALDDGYRGFFELVAGHVGTAITTARAYEDERRRAEALAELDRAKTAFFSNVSHELRTPLTLLIGPVAELLAEPADALRPRHRAELETVHRNARRLLKLVNSLLDFARIEAGRAEVAYEPTDLAALTRDLASVFRSAIERAGLRLTVECEPLPEPAYVDPDMWEKVTLNLLSNAFKHTFEGEIAVSLRQVSGEIVLVVRDTGSGIPEDELPKIFDRFHRVKNARARTHEGTGIGLALVQELVRLHGGTVGSESEPGRGSTFTVRVPAGRAHLPADRVGAARSRRAGALGAAPYVEEALGWLPGPGPSESDLPAGLARARILLADDNADMRDYVRRILAHHWDVDAVADGGAALAAARARVPDLVLADVMMPGLDGFALLRELRADPSIREVPIVLLSARAGEESAVEGLEAGADDYLVKPFSARELVARVGAHLMGAKLRREVTARERAARAEAEAAERRAAVLAGASAALAASLDHETTLAMVVRLAVPAFADYAFIDVAEPQGPIRRVAAAHVDPAKVALLHEVRRRVPIEQNEPHPVSLAFRTGRPSLVADVSDAWLRSIAGGDEHLAIARLLAPRSLMYVPLVTRGRTLGVVTFASSLSGRRYGAADLALAEEIARRAAVAVDNARLYHEAQAAHHRFQDLVQGIDAIVWECDAETCAFSFVSPQAERILGYPVEAWLSDADFWAMRVVHPADRDRALAFCRAEARAGRDHEFEYRAVAADGRVVWLRDMVRVVLDDAGRAKRLRGVMVDVTAARAAREEAESAVRARDAFLARASHELRTPLTSALGTVWLLERALAGEVHEAPEELVRIARRNLDVMLALVNDLLDASKLMARTDHLVREPVALGAGIARSLELVAPQAREKRLAMSVSVPADLVVEGDPLKLEQVLINLLANAVKFSRPGGEVRIEASAEGDEVRLRIRDSGEGIPPEYLERIFEPFFQVGDRGARRPRGTGLGLTICRQIVALHGGRIYAESEGAGRGSTFVVLLPRRPSHRRAA